MSVVVVRGDDPSLVSQAVQRVVGELVGVKLDRTRPLWEIWWIEGLEGGRSALLAKVHHAIIDGVSGTELATVIMDLEPSPPPPEDLVDQRCQCHQATPITRVAGEATARVNDRREIYEAITISCLACRTGSAPPPPG